MRICLYEVLKYCWIILKSPGGFYLRETETLFYFLFIYFNIFYYFLQRGREKDRELETLMREKHQSAASCALPTGDVPATKIHALDWNQTWDPSVSRPTLYPLSQTGQGRETEILKKKWPLSHNALE
uniref:Uncharacterized protein n=1 Tax=Pipistrellus kuhlii TaxID=59472 RepID=A0A7J7X0H8_PIPKU|nr:hypothetical protein mPipKuh1_010790 [Pipistrellus kuhlii]